MTAFRRLLAQKLLWLEETVLVGAILALAYFWLGLPVATTLHLVEHVLVVLAMAALIWLAVWLANRAFGKAALGQALKKPAFWGAAVVALVLGVAVPYQLIWWVPDVASMTAQAVSAGVRFVIAGLLFTGSFLWLHCAAVE